MLEYSIRRFLLQYQRLAGGEGGIRTPDRLAPMPHFECGAFNHSATSPEGAKSRSWAPVVGGVNRRGWRARQGWQGENRAGFPGGPHDVAAAMATTADFGGGLRGNGPEPFATDPARARCGTSVPESLVPAKGGVGPPDAVNTGGPVPLIEILAGKG